MTPEQGGPQVWGLGAVRHRATCQDLAEVFEEIRSSGQIPFWPGRPGVSVINLFFLGTDKLECFSLAFFSASTAYGIGARYGPQILTWACLKHLSGTNNPGASVRKEENSFKALTCGVFSEPLKLWQNKLECFSQAIFSASPKLMTLGPVKVPKSCPGLA